MRSTAHVAVLGAGIMGSATALFLARGGARVTLFDAAPRPFEGASRWSEGKIHLGYLYAAEPTLRTAERVLPGGLAFRALTEQLIGRSIDEAVSGTDDIHLVHRESVVSPEATERYFEAVSALVASHPDAGRYIVDASRARPRKLSASELGEYDPATIIAGYELPERSINTHWLADAMAAALAAEARIDLVMQTRVLGVRPAGETLDGPLRVVTSAGTTGPFDFVVNALWEGRLQVDAPLGLLPAEPWLHRYRLSLFVRTRMPLAIRSALAVTGPFGDLKNFNGHDFYLSWYPVSLQAEGNEAAPPPLPEIDAGRTTDDIFSGLAIFIPKVEEVRRHAEKIDLRGGWIYALGGGRLEDAHSGLHRRDRVGIVRSGSYFSVDTGKYSIAPWLAAQIAEEILGR